jgi:hypothetical protein
MKLDLLRAWIPAAICFAFFVYSCRIIYMAKRSYFPPGSSYKVEVTVTGPDGAVIPAVEPVSH